MSLFNMKLKTILLEMEHDYRGSHKAPGKDDAPLTDLTMVYGDDIQSNNAIRYYGTRIDDNLNYSIIQKARDNPNLQVVIYRAVPAGVTEINDGDWVTLSKKYATTHAKGEKGWKILNKKVKASELYTDGNSWDEWGWNP